MLVNLLDSRISEISILYIEEKWHIFNNIKSQYLDFFFIIPKINLFFCISHVQCYNNEAKLISESS